MVNHDNVSLRIDRYTERFAEIHVRIDLEEIRNRFKRNQRDIVDDRNILVRPRLRDTWCRGAVLALAALRKDGNSHCQNHNSEQNSRPEQPSLHINLLQGKIACLYPLLPD